MGAGAATRAAGRLMSIVVDKDLRSQFGPARDQDPRPTCMAFAASDAHAAARGALQPLSAEWAYYHGLQRDGTAPHAGVTMCGMLEALRLDGQPEEAAWPYIPKLFTDVASWKPPTASPIFRRNSALQTFTVAAILGCLDAEHPVLLTMSISKSFRLPDSDGVIDAIEPLESKRVHALVAVGHGHRQAEKFILVRNSWGDVWGEEGHAWVAVTYLSPRLLRVAMMAGEP